MKVRPHNNRSLAFLCAAAASILIAACGSSSSSSSSSTAQQSGSTGTSPAQTAPAPKGAPIKVMIAATLSGPTNLPEVPYGAKAAADRINSEGGVDGRPIDVIVCDDNAPSPDACARKAISDHVAAVVGSQSAGINPILDANGIPQVGNFPFVGDDFTAANSFPVSAGGANAGGAVKLLASLGVKTIVPLALTGAPAIAASVNFMRLTAAHMSGMKILPTIGLPFPSSDLSAEVAKAAATNAQAMVVLGFPPQNLQVLQAARAAGDTQKLVFSGATFAQVLVSKIGSAANGVYTISSFLPVSATVPAMQQFNKDMAQYAHGQELSDLSLNSWAALHMFAIAAKRAKTIDPNGITKVLPMLKNVDLGITGPFSFGHTGPLHGAPRIVNLGTYYGQVKNGVITAVSDAPQPAYP